MTKISIVLPSYNGERFIRESIDSVLQQSFKDWELILVNDCSTDGTLSIMLEYAKNDSRIKVIDNKLNQKLPKSLNIGFREARGEYLTWTSDDNIYMENALWYMNTYLDNNSKCDLISCRMERMAEDGGFKSIVSNKFRKNVYTLALRSNVGACFLYRKTIEQKIGEYDENLFCAEDYDYWCRIALNGNIEYSDEVLYKYRINSKSLTSTKRDFLREQAEKVRKKYLLKFLEKYKVGYNFSVKCYLKLWKLEKNPKYLFLSIIKNPFLVLFYLLFRNKK